MKKKSYMNKNNLLSESFFTKLAKLLNISKRLQPKNKRFPDKTIADIKNFNKGVDGFEKAWEKLYGKKIHLDRLTIDDLPKG